MSLQDVSTFWETILCFVFIPPVQQLLYSASFWLVTFFEYSVSILIVLIIMFQTRLFPLCFLSRVHFSLPLKTLGNLFKFFFQGFYLRETSIFKPKSFLGLWDSISVKEVSAAGAVDSTHFQGSGGRQEGLVSWNCDGSLVCWNCEGGLVCWNY